MDSFLDGEFLNYGTEVINFMQSDQEDRVDPMIYIFPRMTKCTFYKFGLSGEVERHDAICLLPLNIVNEKIYIFLWFWFIILAILSFLLVVYRIFIITSKKFRVLLFRWHYRRVDKARIEDVVKTCSLGTWYLLYMIGGNIDPGIFCETVEELTKHVKGKNNGNLLELI
jgi:Innexin.